MTMSFDGSHDSTEGLIDYIPKASLAEGGSLLFLNGLHIG